MLSRLVGTYSTSNFIFLFMIFLLLVRVFTMTIRISQLETKVKELVQAMALEQKRLEDMQKKDGKEGEEEKAGGEKL